MFIEVEPIELLDLLDNGTTNQKNFSKQLTTNEFKVFMEYMEDLISEYIKCRPEDYKDILNSFDIRSLLNGGVLEVLTLEEIKEELPELEEEEAEDLEPYEIMDEYADQYCKMFIVGFEDKGIFLE